MGKFTLIKRFEFQGQRFYPFPQIKPIYYKPMMVLTKYNRLYDVIAINTGFGIEFINEGQHVFLLEGEVRGYYYYKD